MKVNCDLISAQLHCSSSVLARPAWWTLKARTRLRLGLLIWFHLEMVQRMLCFRIARETVARDSPSGANFGDLLVAVVTSKGERFLLSSAHYILSPFSTPDSTRRASMPL
jgi:hypothetical protein